MPLPSFFKRPARSTDRRPPPPADEGGPVDAARTRARRRLIGAVVLLAVGVIGFPLIFETQPRPIAVDLPIVAPRKDGAPPLPSPAKPRPAAAAAPSPAAPASRLPDLPDEPATGPASAPTPAPRPAPAAAPRPAPAPTPAPAVTPAPKVEDGARAKALLDGAGASTPQAARFVVQVGAFTDASALREARAKVEKLGLKTYTQVVDTDAGKRTRVRVGPFATREEAERAGSRLKAAGLPAAILAL